MNLVSKLTLIDSDKMPLCHAIKPSGKVLKISHNSEQPI